MAPSQLLFRDRVVPPVWTSSLSQPRLGWAGCAALALSACKGTEPRAGPLLLSSGEFLSLQQPFPPEKAAVLTALPPLRGLLPLRLSSPISSLHGCEISFSCSTSTHGVRGTLGMDCQRQKPPLPKLAGRWWHLLAHRVKGEEGGAGLALGWLEPGTRVSLHLALTHVCCSSL